MEYLPPLNGDQNDPNRSYVDANPAEGEQGSIPPALGFEHPMREIVHVIKTFLGANIPSKDTLTQLAQAIDARINSKLGGFLKKDVTETVEAGFWTKPFPATVAANGDVTLDPTKGNVFKLTATKLIKFKNMQTMPLGGRAEIHLTMDNSGGHGVLWEDQYLPPRSGNIDANPNVVNEIYLNVVAGKFSIDITQRVAS
ncbi:hypothetical protein [uncultured Kiloniella sp.]|uniref:hypothetical protein n=1 Tax=uncultured Kiloniella sp. TaxID=1133091 RepID=UPI002632585A|nr:hypothetical protein [uncultured Kiloniella sp.]